MFKMLINSSENKSLKIFDLLQTSSILKAQFIKFTDLSDKN